MPYETKNLYAIGACGVRRRPRRANPRDHPQADLQGRCEGVHHRLRRHPGGGNGAKKRPAVVAEAFDWGVNCFDVAPSYFNGEAEMKLGPALAPYRERSFLACKTMERGAAGARKELEQSLGRLKTDRFDQILAAGGAAETFVKAREEGKVRFLGASVHDAAAAIALMDHLPLDSVMLPLNFVLIQEGNFGPQILAKAKQKGVARIGASGTRRIVREGPRRPAPVPCLRNSSGREVKNDA